MITLTREEAQQLLDAWDGYDQQDLLDKAIENLRAKLNEPEPEPVAWMYEYGTDRGDAVNEIRWYSNVSLTKPMHGLVRNVVPLYSAPSK